MSQLPSPTPHQAHTPYDQFITDLNAITSQETGVRLIAYLLHQYGLLKPSYSASGHTAFNEGLRSAALFITQELSMHNPKKIPLLIEKIQAL